MKVVVYPKKIEQGSVLIPPSKSMAHRAIICASLANGKSRISNIDYSVDIKTTIAGMRQLGAVIEEGNDYVNVKGIADFNHLENEEICCNESGSTLRFFIPLFSLTQKRIRFTGKNRLLQRPQEIYETLFQSQGIHYLQTEDFIEIEGALQFGEIILRGDVSSQFISGLLFTLPLLKQDSCIRILPPFESRSYVDLTIEMLKKFNVHVEFKDENTLLIRGNQHYKPHDERIEGDYSQLGFFAALGTLNGTIDCLGLRLDSLQGDRQILDIIQAMQGTVEALPEGYRFHPSKGVGTTIDLKNCPDLGPILMVLASFCKGTTTIINAQRLRYKESDRIAAMEQELRKVGVNISSTEDTITIQGDTCWKGNQTLEGHKDHRIVMSLAVGATMADGPITITEAQSITKSYPRFFKDLAALQIKVEEFNDE